MSKLAVFSFVCASASAFALFSAMPTLAQNSQAKQSTAPAKTTSVPASTLQLIRQQAATAQQRAINVGKIESQGEINKAENEAKSVKERAERMAAREGAGGDGPQAEALRRQAAQRADELQQLSKLKAARKEQEAEEKAAEYQRQSDSLQEELQNNQDDQLRGMKLNPVGTNLYVRNYSFVKPNIRPMRAQEQALPVTNTTGRLTANSAQIARLRGKSASSQSHVTADVQGRLLRY